MSREKRWAGVSRIPALLLSAHRLPLAAHLTRSESDRTAMHDYN